MEWEEMYKMKVQKREDRKQYYKKYYLEHKEKHQYSHEYYLAHKEQILAKTTKYQRNHPEKHNEITRRYYENHPEYKKQNLEQLHKWNKEHPEYNNQWKKRNPEKVKEIRRKEKSKRRQLDFNPWNKPFAGCEAHHLNREDVIYIPKALHHSISHNVWTGKNMDKINDLAIGFLKGDLI